MFKSELTRRLFAALWFAFAAAIPVSFDFLVNPMSSGRIYRIITTVVPILAAGIVGLWMGAGILDEKKTNSAWQAVGRGLAIAALSYLLFFIVELTAAVIYNIDSDNIFRLIEMITIMFLIGLGLIGWLIAAVGAAAGGLLYLFRLKTTKEI